MAFSREYLYRECHINKRCLYLHFNKSVKTPNTDTFVNGICILDVLDDSGILYRNYIQKVDSYGDVAVMALDKDSVCKIDLCVNTAWIEELEKRSE